LRAGRRRIHQQPRSCTAADAGAQIFTKTWGETLVYADPKTSAAVPMLAESWEASADVKEWRFKIRKGVTFHDGKALTAGDVVATLKRHSDPNAKSGALGVLAILPTSRSTATTRLSP